jgi:hypothetical protein
MSIGQDLIGKYVIVRTYSAGCHAGFLAARDGREVVLTDSRRLWQWAGAASLSELAQRGTSRPGDCKFPAPVSQILLTEAIEIMAASSEGQASIDGVPVWTR